MLNVPTFVHLFSRFTVLSFSERPAWVCEEWDDKYNILWLYEGLYWIFSI